MSDDKKKERVVFSVGDTVIVKIDDKKNSAVFVNKKTDKYCSGSVLKFQPYDDISIDFMRDQVVCNLGTSPRPGSIYGQYVESYYKSDKCDMGDVHFFMRNSKEEKEKLIKMLNKGYDRMKSKGLAGIFPIITEIRPPKGSYDGHYKKVRGDLDIMCIRPKDELDMKHIMFHELGHGVWMHLFTDKIRAKWIRAYHKQVKIRKLTAKDSKSLYKGVKDEGIPIKEYLKKLEEGNQIILKEILKYISKVHSIAQVDLDTLILAGEDISEFWPTTEMEISEIVSEVSKYAEKDPHEFACEVFAAYMLKEKLPDSLQKLAAKSVETVAGKKNLSDDD